MVTIDPSFESEKEIVGIEIAACFTRKCACEAVLEERRGISEKVTQSLYVRQIFGLSHLSLSM
jgi:hypothetical protein